MLTMSVMIVKHSEYNFLESVLVRTFVHHFFEKFRHLFRRRSVRSTTERSKYERIVLPIQCYVENSANLVSQNITSFLFQCSIGIEFRMLDSSSRNDVNSERKHHKLIIGFFA